MRAGGFPGNPGGLVVSIVKTAGGRAPAHQARGRGRSTWRPTERSRRCSDGTAGRRQRSAGGWTARSRSVSEYRRSGGIEPTRPRGGKGAPAGGTGGGKDGQHTEVGSRLHVTTPDSRTGQISLGDGGGHRLASWTSGYATARSEPICRGAGCGRTRTSGSVGGQGQQRPWSTRPGAGNTVRRSLIRPPSGTSPIPTSSMSCSPWKSQSKTAKHLSMRVAMARFPFQKTIDAFDFTCQPSIDPKVIRELATGATSRAATTCCSSAHPAWGRRTLASR